MDYGKAIWGGVFSGFALVCLLSCGQGAVNFIEHNVSWQDDIAHDATHLMWPPSPHIDIEPSYEIFVYQGE